MKLNLGSGRTRIPGFVNVDKRSLPKVDLVLDLDRVPWPFDDNSVDEVAVHHIFEHLCSPSAAVRELRRICIDGARIHVKFPVGKPTWEDEDHKHALSPEFFKQFDFLKVLEVRKNYPSPKLAKLGFIASILPVETDANEIEMLLEVRKR